MPAKGETLPVGKAWELGRLWYGGYLERGALPGAPLEDEALFRRAGLTSPFWSVG